MMKSLNNKAGFTLLELLVIVAIIGVIGVVATPNIMNWNQSREIQKDLAAMTARIDFARNAAISEGRQLKILLQVNGDDSSLMFLRRDDSTIPTNQNSACSWGAGNVSSAYTQAAFLSKVRGRVNWNGDEFGPYIAAPMDNPEYRSTYAVMCFNTDGTATPGGFLIENGEAKYRIDVFLTGFYSVERYVENANCTAPNCWWERN